jgi:hypothetical protein
MLPMKQGADLDHPEIMAMVAVPGMLNDFDKASGVRCKHCRTGKGCTVYVKRPMGCRLWSCRWLLDSNTAALRRPDRSHYVIDSVPDFVEANGVALEVIQVWVDPDYPDAHQDPGLRDFIERHATPALIRFNEYEGMLIVPPSCASDKAWHDIELPRAQGKWGSLWPKDLFSSNGARL